MHAPINILWTGGWDSTFRLLYIVLVEKKAVQPYYIIDTGRKSTLHELTAIETIKHGLGDKSPQSAALIHDPIITMRRDIRNNHQISRQYHRIASMIHLGAQYEWIALFADYHKINDLELGLIKRQHKTGKSLQDLLAPNLTGKGHDCRLKTSLDNEDLGLFQHFRFPLIGLTKLDMESIARKHGYIDLMRNTWYCFHPTREGFACGRCRPCRVARQSGHAHAPGTFLGAVVKGKISRIVYIGRRLGDKIKSRLSGG